MEQSVINDMRQPGLGDVVELKNPIMIDKLPVSEIRIHHRAGITEMAEVQLAYRRKGISLGSVEVIAVIVAQEILALQVLIDCMCCLQPGTAATLDETHDFWVVAKALTPFISWMSIVRLETGTPPAEPCSATDASPLK